VPMEPTLLCSSGGETVRDRTHLIAQGCLGRWVGDGHITSWDGEVNHREPPVLVTGYRLVFGPHWYVCVC